MDNSSAQMRAVTIPEFGEAEVLRVATMPVPEPGAGQVAFDVAHAGANFAEVLYRRGVVDVPLPFVPGIEVAGRIRAVGEGVEGLTVGQPVAALTIVDSGGYAEVAVTTASNQAQPPASWYSRSGRDDTEYGVMGAGAGPGRQPGRGQGAGRQPGRAPGVSMVLRPVSEPAVVMAGGRRPPSGTVEPAAGPPRLRLPLRRPPLPLPRST